MPPKVTLNQVDLNQNEIKTNKRTHLLILKVRNKQEKNGAVAHLLKSRTIIQRGQSDTSTKNGSLMLRTITFFLLRVRPGQAKRSTVV